METYLVSLEIEGFRSFRKKQVIQFPKGDAVVLVSGKWKDSDTSSGSGKTTILEAIAVCLGISELSVDSMLNWDSKKMCLKLTLQVGQDVVEVVVNPKMSLVINGEKYPGLQLAPKEKLLELLGNNKEMIKTITYRKQRTKGKIIRSTDSQLKEFLTKPLKISDIEEGYEEFVQDANSLQSSYDATLREVQNMESALHMTAVSDQDMTAATEALESARERFSASSSGAADQMKLQLAALQQEAQEVTRLSSNVQQKKYRNATLRTSITSLMQEVEALSKSVCPTCSRGDWDKATEVLNHKNSQIDQMVSELEINAEYIKNADPILQVYPDLEARMHSLNSKIGEASAPANFARHAYSSAEMTFNTLLGKRKNYEAWTSKISESKRRLVAIGQDLEVAKFSSMLVGRSGFLGSIFDEILANIEVRTNDMLSFFPNARHFTIQISSDKVVKTKGTTKKEISVSVFRNGSEVNIDDNCSGGQQGAIELCADLASAEEQRARSGSAIRWMCLDEVMEGLGPDEKKSVIDMIRSRVRGLVLIIDHATEIKESFDQVIHIEYDGRESYVAA